MDIQAILAEADETLKRTAHLCPSGIQERDLTAEIKAETERRIAAVRNDEMRAIVSEMEARLEEKITYERDYMLGLLPELLAEFRVLITDEISEAVGQLRAEVNVQRGIDKGTVTELPNPLVRREPARA